MDALPALVLHRRPWQESSLLLDVFTRDFGVVKICARGVRGKKRSQWSSCLQNFVPLVVQCKTKGEWWHLVEVDPAGAPITLRNDAQLCAHYCTELLLRLLQPHDPHPFIFQHYLSTLLLLSDGQDNASALRQFEWDMLSELGYGMALQFDHAGDVIDAKKMYRFHDQGLWPVVLPTEYDFSGHDLLQLADKNWSQAAVSAKRLLRLMLQPHLGSEPLRTREMWRQYEALKKVAEE